MRRPSSRLPVPRLALGVALLIPIVLAVSPAAGRGPTPSPSSSGHGQVSIQAAPASLTDDPIAPVPFTSVRLTDEFWAPRLEVNRTATIPAIFKKNEDTGRLLNFAIAGRLEHGPYSGQRYNDTDAFKAIEGGSYSRRLHPDPSLVATLDRIIAIIAAAQEPDGYLFTARIADPEHPQPGIGPTRWSELAVSHELYNAGHLYEAAVAHYAVAGKRTLLDLAVRNANLVAVTFGPGRRKGFPGHQEIEIGLVKLARVTGDQKYLDLAAYFLGQCDDQIGLTVNGSRAPLALDKGSARIDREWTPGGDRPRPLTLIPYYAWANRGPGETGVWLRRLRP